MTLLIVAAFALAATTAVPQVSDGPAYVEPIAAVDAAIDAGRLIQARTMMTDWQAKLGETKSPAFDLRLATLAAAEGHDDLALAEFQVLQRSGFRDCRVDEGLGRLSLSDGRTADAEKALDRATAGCPERWQVWNLLGSVRDLQGRFAESARAYERAYQRTDRPGAVINNYAFSLLLQHRPEEAVRLFEVAVEAEPQNARYRNNENLARASAGLDPLEPTEGRGWDQSHIAHLLDAARVRSFAGDRLEASKLISEALMRSETDLPDARRSLDWLSKDAK